MNKRIFITLFFSVFTAVTGVGIVIPLLPVYAHHLGAGGMYIGLIFGSFSISRTFFLPYFGRLSDKKGRKPFITAGLSGYALVSLAFILTSTVESLIVIRFLQGIASAMIMPVTQAYVGEITPPGREGFNMGLFNMSTFIGLSAGPLMGGLINQYFSLKTAFVCMGLLSAAGVVASLLFLPPTKNEPIVVKPKRIKQSLLWDKETAGLFLFRFAYTVCVGIIWCFLPVYADAEFSLSSTRIGILVMLGVFISGLLHTPMGYIADRANKKMLVALGGMTAGCGVFLFVRAGGFWDLFAADILFGIGGGTAMPALMALAVIKGSQTNAMGSIMALITMGHSLGMLVGSIAAGLMMDEFQLRLAFPFGSFIMVLGVIAFLFCMIEQKPFSAEGADIPDRAEEQKE